MTRLSADNLLAAGAVWVSIMLPSAAFGENPFDDCVVTARAERPVSADLHDRQVRVVAVVRDADRGVLGVRAIDPALKARKQRA